jgi:hypothetical protein
MGDLLEMMMTMVSPSGREVPPAESLRRRAKVLLPKFRLETATLHPGSPLLIFSKSERLIYQKGGLEGWLGWATPPGRARGPGTARWVLFTAWAPFGSYLL